MPLAAYGVIVDLISPPDYTVTLVAADGHIAAQAHAVQRSVMAAFGTAGLPYISISRTRVYFLDGDSGVRWIDPTGATGSGPQLPGSKTTPVAFAVSPDDSRIAVTRYDLSANPVFLQLYTDSIGGGNQNYIFKSQSDYIWPVGWHGGSIVLAAQTFPPYTQPGGRAWNPYGATAYHVVDPDNADRLFTLGSGEDLAKGCQPTGPLTSTGSACSLYGDTANHWGTIGILDWTGKYHVIQGPLHDPSGVGEVSSASPDAGKGQVVFCCDTFGNFWIAGKTGYYVKTELPGTLGPGAQRPPLDWACWLDGTHLLGPTGTYVIGDKTATPVNASGFCAGVLPAAFD